METNQLRLKLFIFTPEIWNSLHQSVFHEKSQEQLKGTKNQNLNPSMVFQNRIDHIPCWDLFFYFINIALMHNDSEMYLRG